MKKLPLLLAVASVAAACSTPPTTGPNGLARLVNVKGEVRQVAGKGFKLKGVDAARVPYELRRLDHIDVMIRNMDDVNDSGHLAGTLNFNGATDIDHTFDPIVLTKLRAYTNYKVTLTAYQFDPAAGEVVQVDDNTDGASETDFSTFLPEGPPSDAANENVTLPNGFSLKLRDQDFSGVANGDINASNGILRAPLDPEALQTPAPPPPPPEPGIVNFSYVPLSGDLGNAGSHLDFNLNNLPTDAQVTDGESTWTANGVKIEPANGDSSGYMSNYYSFYEPSDATYRTRIFWHFNNVSEPQRFLNSGTTLFTVKMAYRADGYSSPILAEGPVVATIDVSSYLAP